MHQFVELLRAHPDRGVDVEALDVNPTIGMRSQQLDERVHSVSVGRGSASRATKAAIKALTPQQLRRDFLRLTQRRIVAREPPPPDERFMLELRRRFKPEVVALSEYLDRD